MQAQCPLGADNQHANTGSGKQSEGGQTRARVQNTVLVDTRSLATTIMFEELRQLPGPHMDLLTVLQYLTQYFQRVDDTSAS